MKKLHVTMLTALVFVISGPPVFTQGTDCQSFVSPVVHNVQNFMAVNHNSSPANKTFEINGEHFLFFSHYRSGTNGDITEDKNSEMYKWNGQSFDLIQYIPTHAPYASCYFEFDGEHFFTIANYRSGSSSTSFSYDSQSPVYKWNGSSFDLVQSLSTGGAQDIISFNINNIQYLAIANYYHSSDRYDHFAKIYYWDGAQFSFSQQIATHGARDLEYFEINGESFLAIANYYSSTNGSYHDQVSKIYKFNGSSFSEINTFNSSGARKWKYFSVDGQHFLFLVNYYTKTSNSYDINSKIYKWNGISFSHFQNIPTHGGINVACFSHLNKHFLAIANGCSVISGVRNYDTNSAIYQWDGTGFTHYQDITTSFCRHIKPVVHDDIQYLCFANYRTGTNSSYNYQTESSVYKFDGQQFVQIENITTYGGRHWEALHTGDRTFLILANLKSGDNTGWNANVNSHIFELTDPESTNGIKTTEYQALTDFYCSTGGKNWSVSWELNDQVNNWEGVTISNEHITSIDLPDNNITGDIPQLLNTLPTLNFLNLSGNNITHIPDFSSMAGAPVLNVSGNNIPIDDLMANRILFEGNSSYYHPQDEVPISPSLYNLPAGQSVSVDLASYGMSHSANQFEMYKDGRIIQGYDYFEQFTLDDMGEYNWQVKNTGLPGLVIETSTISVDVGFTYGDVNNDARITSFDAAIVLNHSVDNDTERWGLPCPWKTWQEYAANVDGIMDLDDPNYLIGFATDAGLILRKAVGYDDPFPVTDLKNEEKPPAASVEVRLAEGAIEFISEGEMISFHAELDFPAARFNGIPELINENMMLAWNYESTPYRIAVVAANPPVDGVPFLRIPFNGSFNTSALTVHVNGQKQSLQLQTTSAIAAESNIKQQVSHYPNPFSGEINISFTTTQTCHATLEIFDARGIRMKKILDKNVIPGSYSFTWKGQNNTGRKLAPGLYFYKLSTDKETVINQVIMK
jgi:hypothetical protein